MANLKAYYGVDFSDFDLNFYKNRFESQRIVVDSKDPTNAGSDDRYSIWTDKNSDWAVAFHGHDFAYDGERFATKGRVEAFSEWFYNIEPDEAAGEVFGRTRKYLLKDIDIRLEDFIDVLKTDPTADDDALLKKILKGDDIINLSVYNDVAYGHGGRDVIKGNAGRDSLYGGSGLDQIQGGTDNDKIHGGSGNDRLRGDKGNDRIWGENGADRIDGGKGSDQVWGGDKNDTIRGGAGRDKLWGQDGNDTFVFMTGDQKDFVEDWEAGDVVDLSGLASITDWTDLTENHMWQANANVVIGGGDGDRITLKNTDMTTLVEANFDFGETVLV